jgi:GT2 family glycosyltransferase
MQLSIIIVNYNVQYFLEQCLNSVDKAIRNIDAEVIVVDNNSVDQSLHMLKLKFPWVKIIANTENTGFSKANNQGIAIAKGQYILLLNPDTLVKEDTFSRVIEYMDSNAHIGGLGVKMYDGAGKLLPESKRGLPTPETSFYKISGLYRLFPRNARINRYYMGNLSYDENQEIEILSGAFMFMRKDALDQVGWLDEDFFMYGEDIDLSWRIIQGGWKNAYFAETSIIHYKGESTKKGSLNYVYVFYNAMGIFAKKHFSKGNASAFTILIQLAIWMRASMSFLKRIVSQVFLPLTDITIVYGIIHLMATYYSQWQEKNFDSSLIQIYGTLYSLFLFAALYLSGAYLEIKKVKRTVTGILWTSFMTLLVYSLLPETIRFSRMVILLSSFSALFALPLWHKLYTFIFIDRGKQERPDLKRILVLGSEAEFIRIEQFLKQTNYQCLSIEHSHSLPSNSGEYFRVNQIQELIFCAKDLSSHEIIKQMNSLSHLNLEFKIAPPESLFIIGSQHIQSSSDTIFVSVNNISSPLNRRQKRAFDVITSLFFFVCLPLMLFTKKQRIAISQLVAVLFGQKSWIGYTPQFNATALPKIQPGVFSPSTEWHLLNEEGVHQMNALYAKDYSVWNDLRLMYKHLF